MLLQSFILTLSIKKKGSPGIFPAAKIRKKIERNNRKTQMSIWTKGTETKRPTGEQKK